MWTALCSVWLSVFVLLCVIECICTSRRNTCGLDRHTSQTEVWGGKNVNRMIMQIEILTWDRISDSYYQSTGTFTGETWWAVKVIQPLPSRLALVRKVRDLQTREITSWLTIVNFQISFLSWSAFSWYSCSKGKISNLVTNTQHGVHIFLNTQIHNMMCCTYFQIHHIVCCTCFQKFDFSLITWLSFFGFFDRQQFKT